MLKEVIKLFFSNPSMTSIGVIVSFELMDNVAILLNLPQKKNKIILMYF